MRWLNYVILTITLILIKYTFWHFGCDSGTGITQSKDHQKDNLKDLALSPGMA